MVLMGMSFFEKFFLTIDVKNHLAHLPDISMLVPNNSEKQVSD